MFFRQLLNDDTACASYLFGYTTVGELAVVDAHADLVDDYVATAEAQGSRIAAVLETHVQADHVSGLPELVDRTRLRLESEDAFVAAVVEDIPPAPEHQAEIVAANRSGRTSSALA